MQATVSDLSDEDVVINFCLQNKIAKTAIDELLRRGYNSLEALALVEMEDLVSPKIPKGQRRLILHIAATLQRKKTESSLNSSAGATENGAASVAVSTETTDISTTNQQPVTISDEGARRGVSVNRGTSESENGVQRVSTNDSGDLYDRVNFLFQEQQKLSAVANSEEQNQPAQASWSDPQIHLTTAAGKSSANYLDICDFVQSSVEEEIVLGGQGDQQIVVKSGPKKPKLENVTLSQWSVANLAILYQLVRENKLKGPSLFDYLSYTTKVYQLVQRYSLISVLLYDREYRKLQAALKFRWGTDVQHLSSIHLQARDKPAAQGNQQKKQTVPNKLGKSSKTKSDIVCRNFKSQKGCSFQDCKFKHTCIIPGCKEAHSAVNHYTGK